MLILHSIHWTKIWTYSLCIYFFQFVLILNSFLLNFYPFDQLCEGTTIQETFRVSISDFFLVYRNLSFSRAILSKVKDDFCHKNKSLVVRYQRGSRIIDDAEYSRHLNEMYFIKKTRILMIWEMEMHQLADIMNMWEKHFYILLYEHLAIYWMCVLIILNSFRLDNKNFCFSITQSAIAKSHF